MSYNVDTWKTKELVNLRIPVVHLFEHPRKDWHPKLVDNNDGTVTFSISDQVLISGKMDNDTLVVSEIKASGECSGIALHWIIEPALRHSTGKLVANRVWEGGDYIDKLVCVNGDVSWVPIEI